MMRRTRDRARRWWIWPAVLSTIWPVFVPAQQMQSLGNINSEIERRAAALETVPPTAVIGPGDVLSIRVFQVPDLTGEYTVESDGTLSMPFVTGKITAAGRSVVALAEEVEVLLKSRNLVNDPQVVINIKEYHSGPVAVMGAVRQPTVFQASHPTRLLGALARAGGLDADAGNLVIVRRGSGRSSPAGSSPAEEQPMNIDLGRLLSGEDPSLDMPIFGGDTITVPRGGLVYVLGAVRRPGGFSLKNGDEQMTALKALALAEDVKPTAQPRRSAIIRKTPDGPETTIPVDLSKVLAGKLPNPRLQPDDILFIPDSSGKKALWRGAEAALQIGTGVVIWRR